MNAEELEVTSPLDESASAVSTDVVLLALPSSPPPPAMLVLVPNTDVVPPSLLIVLEDKVEELEDEDEEAADSPGAASESSPRTMKNEMSVKKSKPNNRVSPLRSSGTARQRRHYPSKERRSARMTARTRSAVID